MLLTIWQASIVLEWKGISILLWVSVKLGLNSWQKNDNQMNSLKFSEIGKTIWIYYFCFPHNYFFPNMLCVVCYVLWFWNRQYRYCSWNYLCISLCAVLFCFPVKAHLEIVSKTFPWWRVTAECQPVSVILYFLMLA